ncbi:MAG: hypothetical protein GY788_18980 [bacterium]|nr:hypothetical protein [bacterium]
MFDLDELSRLLADEPVDLRPTKRNIYMGVRCAELDLEGLVAEQLDAVEDVYRKVVELRDWWRDSGNTLVGRAVVE